MFLLLIALYILLVFIGIRLVIPYYGFTNTKATKEIPEEFHNIIEELNKSSKTNKDLLKNCYEYLTSRYYGSRFEIFPKWKYAFEDIFIHKQGFVPCNVFNQLLKTMLVRSGRFSNDEVKTQVVFLNFFIHQYLKVKIDDNWIAVDSTYKKYGISFGKRAIWFA